MSPASARRTTLAVCLDVVIFAVGVAVAVPCVARWLTGQQMPGYAGIVAITLIVVFSRFPLVLAHQSGDIVIGFETCSLVFLVLTVPPIQALALWAIGTTIANATARKSWRSTLFNIGLTIQAGGLLVLVVALVQAGPNQRSLELAAVMLGCAIYFLFDLLTTAGSLALEDGTSLSSALRWRSVSLGLASFVGVDTLGYLAALLQRSQPSWTLLLLLVPVGTILVAVGSVSRTQLAHRRLAGLLEAATQAPDWADEHQIDSALVVQAQRTLRRTEATLRATPADPPEISAPIQLEGRPDRHLVARRLSNGENFDTHDQVALEALAAIGVSALNRRRLAADMSYLARHDVLTGLFNRGVFADRLTHALERRGPRRIVAVLYCDLDGFKEVNDLLGHEAGDRLLVAVADRVRSCLRPEDTAARLGGDEFGILLDSLNDEAQAEEVAQRLLDALAPAFHTEGHDIPVQASIGIAHAGQEPLTAEALLNSADTAMYAAKALGKGRTERFVPAMRTSDLRRRELEAALRLAVEEDRIRVHYQPVIDLNTGAIRGFEALARWTHPSLGVVPPDTFIPIAERLGLIRTLGLQILERSHRGALRLSERAGRPLQLAVNLSATQISDPDLTDRVTVLLREHPQVPLVLELTEGTLLGDDSPTVAALHTLKACGAKLAVDDFGTGYSSVGYLHRLPVDILKIDKLFVHELHDPRSHALMQGVIAMAQAMDLTVVTEGVEDWHSAQAVRDLGCDLAQGNLFSRPVELRAALEIARTGRVDVSPMMTTSRYAVPSGER
ncbi:MAG TPA: EAL domain-containing protein [Actinomycetes bacterium]